MNIRHNNDGYYDDIEKKLGFVERVKKCVFAGGGTHLVFLTRFSNSQSGREKMEEGRIDLV